LHTTTNFGNEQCPYNGLTTVLGVAAAQKKIAECVNLAGDALVRYLFLTKDLNGMPNGGKAFVRLTDKPIAPTGRT